MARSKTKRSACRVDGANDASGTTPAQPPNPEAPAISGAESSLKMSPHPFSENGDSGAVVPTDSLRSNGAPANPAKSVEIAEKIKELVRLAQEQGYLTYGDINDVLPESVIAPEELDEIYIK